MPDLQMRPAVLRLALSAGGAGGWRRGFEFAAKHAQRKEDSIRLL